MEDDQDTMTQQAVGRRAEARRDAYATLTRHASCALWALSMTRYSSAWAHQAAGILRAVSAHAILTVLGTDPEDAMDDSVRGGSKSGPGSDDGGDGDDSADEDRDDDDSENEDENDDDENDDDDDNGHTANGAIICQQSEAMYRTVLDRLDIPVGNGGTRGCRRAVDALVALWRDLDAHRGASEMVRAYLHTWPPSRGALTCFLRGARRHGYERDIIHDPSARLDVEIDGETDVNGRTLSPAALVGALADVARSAASRRAFDEAQRLRNASAPLCARDRNNVHADDDEKGHSDDEKDDDGDKAAEIEDDDGDVNEEDGDDIQYLVACTSAYTERCDAGVLVGIARGDAANGTGTLFGRACPQGPTARHRDPPPDAPPAIESLPLWLRPYAGFIPALLSVFLDHRAIKHQMSRTRDTFWWDPLCDLASQHDATENANDRDDEDGRADALADPFARHLAQWKRVASAAVASLIRHIEPPGDVPPRVVLRHMHRTTPCSELWYAWIDRDHLERLLAAVAVRHVLSVAALARRPRVETDPAALGPGQRRRRDRKEGASPTTTRRLCPATLAVQARAAIVRSRARVLLDPTSLPPEVADPLALAIWLDECTRAGDPSYGGVCRLHHHRHHGDERLIEVARHWGVEPSPMQMLTPGILCGALARHAVARGLLRGAATHRVPRLVTRVGPPLLTTEEHWAVGQVCAAPENTRFLWIAPDAIDSLVHDTVVREHTQSLCTDPTDASVPYRIVYSNSRPFFSFSRAGAFDGAVEPGSVGDHVRLIIAEANARYNVTPDESPPHVATLETRVQVLLAVATVRSGLAIRPADLADAGTAAALIGPLAALFP